LVTDISASTGRMGDTWWVIIICPCVNVFSLMGGVTEADVDFPTGRCAVNLERGDTVQVTMPKPYIKYKIISSSRS
jgi:hypothetical protein